MKKKYNKFNLENLYKIIEYRIESQDKNSYTYKTYRNPKFLYKKIKEEAKELTRTKNKKQVIWEAADLFYFVTILLAKRKVSFSKIYKKLEQRNINKLKNRHKKVRGVKMRVLFICKYNRFRSRVAEAYFRKICKKKGIIAESAGVIEGFLPLSKNQVKTAKKFGIDINGKPRTTSMNLLKKQDLIIIVADDVPKEIFNYKGDNNKIIVWKIPDVKTGSDEKGNVKSIKLIIKRVDILVKKLCGEK